MPEGFWGIARAAMLSSVEIGLQAFKEKRYGEAVALFEEVRRVQPDNHKLIYLLGQGYQALGRMQEARQVFNSLLHQAEPRLAEMARQAIAALGDQGLVIETTPEPEPPPALYCPKCGEEIPAERAAAPWCACGYGKKVDGQRLYVAHLLAFARTHRVVVELKSRGDLYAVGVDVRLKHMSDQMTKVDPRQVFRVDRGVPYLVPEDLDPVVPKIDEHAQFRLRKAGTDMVAGKLMAWIDLRAKIIESVGDPRVAPDGSLGAILVAYGNVPEAVVLAAEQEGGKNGLGSALVQTGACSVQDLLAGALGASRVPNPKHHQANHLGRILFDMGAVHEDALKRALVAQVKQPRPLVDYLRQAVAPQAMSQAIRKWQDLPDQSPERDRLGEVLNEMGVLSRTDLAHALEERRRKNKLIGRIFVEQGFAPARSVEEALVRQRLKREARMAGEVMLGQVLIDLGMATPKAIAVALVQQVQQPRPLGELLIHAQACTPEQIITGLSEQEQRLDALVAERLPAELEARDAEGVTEDETGPLRDRLPLEDEAESDDEEDEAPKRRWWLAVPILGGIALVYGLSQSAMSVWKAMHPPIPEPPMAKALPKTPREQAAIQSFTSMNAKNKVEVDMDQVVKRIEKGEADPLGGEFMAAYRKKGAGIRPDQLSKVVGAPLSTQPIPRPATHPELAHPVADERPGESPSLEPIDVQKTMGMPEQVVKGDRLAAAGRPAEAVQQYQAALRDAPNDPDVLTKLGEAQLSSGHPMDAEETLTRASLLSPEDPRTQVDLGEARLARRDAAGAVLAFSKAAKADPKNAGYQNQLGLAFQAAQQPGEAARAFLEATKLDPSNPNAHYNLAMATIRQDPKAAKDHFALAAQGFGSLVETRMAYAEALQAQGDLPGARQGYQGSLKANTLLAETHMALGKLALVNHDPNQAKTEFMAAKATYRTNAIAHTRLGDVLQSLHRLDEAKGEWLTATAIAPFYAPPFYSLGVAASAKGQVAEARRYLNGAITADPGGPLVLEARRALSRLK